ncbi:MAG: diguanylate cyclase [Oscillospiraceae bacterium]
METVLSIDDSILNLTVLARILNPYYNYVITQSGEMGIEKAFEIKPSLILLDVIMQGIDGFEVLKRLKADIRTQDIPVIFITGMRGDDLEERALKVGAVDFISKPFRPSVVLARVNTHIELYTYRKNAEQMAMIDAMTNIPNRRSFDVQIKDALQKCKENNILFSLAIADIDFFKGYNDNYGHMAGDNAIRSVAYVLQQTLEPINGIVSRIGGEEFACLFVGANSDEVQLMLEKVRRNLQMLAIQHRASLAASVITLSIGGVTVSSSYEMSLDAVLEYADKMLYKAKENGRNNVQFKII